MAYIESNTGQKRNDRGLRIVFELTHDTTPYRARSGEAMSLIARLFGLDAERICEEGLSALGRRDFEAAARAFHSCEESSRREATVRLARFHLAECHTQLALASWGKSDFEKARDEIEVALAYSQPTAERHLIAAQVARRLGDSGSAAYHVGAALERVPDHEHALALHALQCYECGRADEAITQSDALQTLDTRVRRFREAHERGDRETAVTHLAAVAAGYPDSLI